MTSKLLSRYLALSPAQRKAAADRLGTSVPALRIMSHAYRTGGKPSLSADMAGKVERVLDVPRESTCLACAKCNLAKIARKVPQA